MSQVLTYDTVVGRELGLQDRMTALRNLRPGTRLSWPEGDLSREVLRELLSLSESVDVLRWLEAERGAAVALLAIEQSLDMAGMMSPARRPEQNCLRYAHKRARTAGASIPTGQVWRHVWPTASIG